MGIYSKYIFPTLMDLACRHKKIGEYRKDLLKGVQGHILEIGFGTGINLEYYPDRVKAINVVEPNPGMEKKSAKRQSASKIKVGYYLGGSEKLPFENQTFDSVVSTFTLCSIPDVELALWELHRVLKSGGKLFFLEHGLSEEPKVAERQKRWTPWQKRFADGCHLDRDIAGLISTAGFKFQDIKKFYFPKGFKMFSYFYQGVAQKMGVQSYS